VRTELVEGFFSKIKVRFRALEDSARAFEDGGIVEWQCRRLRNRYRCSAASPSAKHIGAA
jgi:hypothetical protein